jgi:predicted transcriptional regulator
MKYMRRKRRSHDELDSKIKSILEKFDKNGASIREIAVKANINWHTTMKILKRFEKLGLVENIFTHQRLKIYRLKRR